MNNALVAMGPTLMNLTSTSIVRIFANMSNATVAQQLRGTRECTACPLHPGCDWTTWTETCPCTTAAILK